MRVLIDNGRKTVDIEQADSYGNGGMFAFVIEALNAMGFTEKDIVKHIEEKED